MKEKKILLTGASGFLGRYVFEYLSEKNFFVETLGRQNSSLIIPDISNPIPDISEKYDLVVHCAGKAHVLPKTEKEAKQFFDINHTGTMNLCKALCKNVPNTFVFISTIAVYGRDECEELTEEAELQGKTPYAKSKILAEEFLQVWCTEHKINLMILRLPLVAGMNANGNLGAMVKGIKKGYYFNITGNEAQKSIVLASDIAQLIPKLFEKNGIYNLSGDENYSFEEISRIISNQMNGKRIIALPYFLVRVFAYIGDYMKFIPIDSLKLKKITSSLTVSAEKASEHLDWSPSSLKQNFKI